jgi:hypothetical protein
MGRNCPGTNIQGAANTFVRKSLGNQAGDRQLTAELMAWQGQKYLILDPYLRNVGSMGWRSIQIQRKMEKPMPIAPLNFL